MVVKELLFFFCWGSQAGSAINSAQHDLKTNFENEKGHLDTGDSGDDRRISEPSPV